MQRRADIHGVSLDLLEERFRAVDVGQPRDFDRAGARPLLGGDEPFGLRHEAEGDVATECRGTAVLEEPGRELVDSHQDQIYERAWLLPAFVPPRSSV